MWQLVKQETTLCCSRLPQTADDATLPTQWHDLLTGNSTSTQSPTLHSSAMEMTCLPPIIPSVSNPTPQKLRGSSLIIDVTDLTFVLNKGADHFTNLGQSLCSFLSNIQSQLHHPRQRFCSRIVVEETVSCYCPSKLRRS